MRRRNLARLRSALLVAATILLHGCDDPGRVYAVPLPYAQRTLASLDVPREVLGSAPLDTRVLAGPSDVIWRVDEDGAEQMHFAAHLEPAAPSSTRIRVTVGGPDTGPHAGNAARLKARPSITRLYVAAMNEQIAAALEHRAYDRTRIYPALMQAAADSAGALAHRFDGDNAAYHREERANMEKAYAEESARR